MIDCEMVYRQHEQPTILDRILRRTDVASLLVSEADILDGIAWSLA